MCVAIFHREFFEGDRHLYELIQRRFTEAHLGAEFYPPHPGHLEETLEFRPLSQPHYTMHLPRHIGLLSKGGHLHKGNLHRIGTFAARSRSDAYGMIIHDQQGVVTWPERYLEAVREINRRLLAIDRSPMLFIEYAVGLEPEAFAGFFEEIANCEKISACLDTGHVGIRKVGTAYAEMRSGETIAPGDPDLASKLPDITEACDQALPTVLGLIESLGETDKPLHFHLHDGHPLSTIGFYSDTGVRDHLPFDSKVEIPPLDDGEPRELPLIFGPQGLTRIVKAALAAAPRERLSFNLEIHPHKGDSLALGEYEPLFRNWEDKTNAEKTHAWLQHLVDNQAMLQTALS